MRIKWDNAQKVLRTVPGSWWIMWTIVIIKLLCPSTSFNSHMWVLTFLKLIHCSKEKNSLKQSCFPCHQILTDLSDLKYKFRLDKEYFGYETKKIEIRLLKCPSSRSSSLSHLTSQNSNMYTESLTCPNAVKWRKLGLKNYRKLFWGFSLFKCSLNCGIFLSIFCNFQYA